MNVSCLCLEEEEEEGKSESEIRQAAFVVCLVVQTGDESKMNCEVCVSQKKETKRRKNMK